MHIEPNYRGIGARQKSSQWLERAENTALVHVHYSEPTVGLNTKLTNEEVIR